MGELKLIGGYPEYIRELIEVVNRTRHRRKDFQAPAMSREEREEVLNNYHPDFTPGGKREISLGPNKGDIGPNPVVDLNLRTLPIHTPLPLVRLVSLPSFLALAREQGQVWHSQPPSTHLPVPLP